MFELFFETWKNMLIEFFSNPFVYIFIFLGAIFMTYIGYIPVFDDIAYFVVHHKKMPAEYREELKSRHKKS